MVSILKLFQWSPSPIQQFHPLPLAELFQDTLLEKDQAFQYQSKAYQSIFGQRLKDLYAKLMIVIQANIYLINLCYVCYGVPASVFDES